MLRNCGKGLTCSFSISRQIVATASQLQKIEYAMAKTICDWSKKDLAKNSDKLHSLTMNPCYFCQKCGRVANTKKALCRAEKFAMASKIAKIDFAA